MVTNEEVKRAINLCETDIGKALIHKVMEDVVENDIDFYIELDTRKGLWDIEVEGLGYEIFGFEALGDITGFDGDYGFEVLHPYFVETFEGYEYKSVGMKDNTIFVITICDDYITLMRVNKDNLEDGMIDNEDIDFEHYMGTSESLFNRFRP